MSRKDKKNKSILPRKNKLTLYLNDKEMVVLKNFMKKYHFENQNEAVRKALFTYIIKQLSDDYPQLFPTDEISFPKPKD